MRALACCFLSGFVRVHIDSLGLYCILQLKGYNGALHWHMYSLDDNIL